MYIEMFNLSLLHFNKKHTVGMKVNCIFFFYLKYTTSAHWRQFSAFFFGMNLTAQHKTTADFL